MTLTGIAAVTGEYRFVVRSCLKGLPGLEGTSPVAVQGFSTHHQSASTGSQITTFALAVVLG